MKAYLIRKMYVINVENDINAKDIEKMIPNLSEDDLISAQIWRDINKDIKNTEFASMINEIRYDYNRR